MKTHIEQYDVHFLKIQVYTHALKTKILYVAHTAENFWVRPWLVPNYHFFNVEDQLGGGGPLNLLNQIHLAFQ